MNHGIHLKWLLLAGLLITGQAMAVGDPSRGEQKSQPCQACHGKHGESSAPNFPKLAGQYASYLTQALHEYRDGTRKNAIMPAFASQLSDQDIEDLAAWFSSQKGLEVLSHDD